MTNTEERSHSGTVVAVVIFGLMFAAITYRYWPSHQRDVLRHVVNLAETLSIDGAESEALTATRFAALREYFAPDVRITFDTRDIVTRDAVLQAIRAWTPPPGGMLVDFVDIQITMADDERSAVVDMTAHLSARNVPRDQSLIGSRQVHASMDRRDGDWVVRTAELRPSGQP